MPIGTGDGNYYEDEFHQTLAENNFLSSTNKDLSSLPNTPGEGLDSSPPAKSQPQGMGEYMAGILKDTWPAKAVEGLVDAFKLPGDVYQGKVDINSPEGSARASEAALNIGIGGLSTAPLRPGIGMFGGRFTPEAANLATKMAREGFHPTTIKEMTGLERGADTFWRREFSDASARLNKNPQDGMFMDELLHHPQLYETYPQARDIQIKVAEEGRQLGAYDPNTGVIHLKKGMSEEETRKTLLHEIQHWIQDREGFAFDTTGTLDKIVSDTAKREYILGTAEGRKLLQNVEDLKAAGRTDEAKVVAKDLLDLAEYGNYTRLASEVEARNVETRMNMRPSEIKQSLGRETEDVPRSLQLFGNGGDEVLPSTKPSYPEGYFDKIPQDTRLSRTGVSHPGYRWEVYDRHTGKVERNLSESRSQSTTRVNRLDNKYGGYRYGARPVKASIEDMSENEIKTLTDAGFIDFFK